MKENQDKGILKRFIAYYKPHKKLFAWDMVASLLISLTAMIYPLLTRRMLNIYIPERMYSKIITAGLTVFFLYTLRLYLRYFVQYYGHMIGTYMQAKMRTDLFTHLQKLPFEFYDEHETGRIMTRMTSDLFDVVELAHHGPENILTCSVMVVLSFVYLCSIDIWLTLIVFACVPILVVTSIVFRKKMRKAFDDRRKSNAIINGAVESSITGIRVTKAFTNSQKELEKFEVGNEKFIESSADAYKAMGMFHSTTSYVTDIFNVFILIAGGLFLYAGRINFGDYSTFIVSINLFISPINTLIQFVEQYQNGVSGFRRFIEIMDMEPETDKEGAKELGTVKGEIELSHVSFNYRNGESVLQDVCLKVPVGEKLALVGESGGGKTTICHLIPNFYKLDSNDDSCGKILVDGTDIRDVTMESLRKNIGIVQQDVFLFSGTIMENIRYGKLDATDEEVFEAARRANIHEYITGLENGYDTEIGERGVKLSGGQKQRLSIARVFLKNPAILILDEATSALDNATEMLIQQSLDELCKGRTTIVVAHRLSTIRNADNIAVIMDGKVTEYGTHIELLELKGTYNKLVQGALV